MSPLPTTGRDLRAVVRAADALTTQVRRIADALETPVVEYEVAEADAPTTTGDGARIAQWIPEPPGAAEHRARVAEWITRGTRDLSIPEQAPAADEDALRATRRESARIILDRATRGIALRSDESALLRQHFDAETREHDTARAVAAGNKRHVQVMYAELQQAEARVAELEARDTPTWRKRAEQAEELLSIAHETSNRSEIERAAAVQRAEQAELELRVLRSGLRANGADPTQIQNLWAQIRLRNRQWRDAKRERDEAQAAFERVRTHVTGIAQTTAAGLTDYDIGSYELACGVLAALDGTEQPTTEDQPEPPERNFAAYQAAIARVVLVLREARQHREQTDPSERQDCVMCGADHFAEIRDAIKGKKPTTEA